MQFWIAKIARDNLRTGSADTTNLPRATRTRKLRSKKKMSVTLQPQQKTTPPSSNTRKVVSKTGKTTAKTPCSWIQKTLRKKLHQDTKANRRCQIRRRGLMKKMMTMREPMPRTTTATLEATRIPAMEESRRNGWCS